MEIRQVGERIELEPRRKEKAPIDYDYERGSVMYLSAVQKLICDTYLKTWSYTDCSRAVEEKTGRKIKYQTIKKWLDFPWMQSYLEGKVKDEAMKNGYTKEKFMRELIEYKNGLRKEGKNTVLWMEMLRKSLKIGEGEGVTVNNLHQINFTQRDGAQ